jgi:hypothetical protein
MAQQNATDEVEETVTVSRSTLARLYGSTRSLVEMNDQQMYAADSNCLAEAENALGRTGPYSEDDDD